MQLVIKPTGVLVAIYDDHLDYGELGKPRIRRVSCVEPDEQGRWFADMTLSEGPILGPFDKRHRAITAELEYLNTLLSADTTDSSDFTDFADFETKSKSIRKISVI